MNYIKTERLLLRSWKSEDLEPFSNMNKDEKVMEYSSKILTDDESKEYFEKIKAHFLWHNFGLFAVELLSTGNFIGYVGLAVAPYDFWPQKRPCVEIGWRLIAKYWGKGYATEAAKASLQYGYNTLKLDEIVAFTRKGNFRSIRVIEKLNMQQISWPTNHLNSNTYNLYTQRVLF